MPAREAAAAGRAGTRRALAAGLAVALAAALPYLAAGIPREFVNLDDPDYVTGNPRVLGGLSLAGVRWAASAFDGGGWHPLTWLSHMLDVSLFGLAPAGHHASSVALHALAAALLFAALRRLTGSLWTSALAAALFGAHPLHVESVAWVAERKDVLAGLCFALVLLAYERYARRGGLTRSLAVFLLLALGLAAKPMLVTVPLVLLLLDVWPLGRLRLLPRSGAAPPPTAPARRVLLEKLPLLALSASCGAVTLLAQSAVGSLARLDELAPADRLANALVAAATYVLKAFWPSPLAVYYPYPPGGHPWWMTLGAALALAAATWIALSQARRRPWLAVGWLWFVVMLAPVSGIVQAGQQSMADRYTYLPLVGPFVAAAWTLAEASRRGRVRRIAVPAACAVALAGLTAAAAVQAGRWRDDVTLYEHTLAVTRENWMIHNNLGIALDQRGRTGEALAHYREALRLKPAWAEAHNNFAVASMKTGEPALGIAHFREALRLNPGLVEARVNLSRALASQGQPGSREP